MSLQVGRKTWIGLSLAVLLAAGLAWWWFQREQAAAPSYRTAQVERGALTATVAATGTLNPVTSVQVGTQVSGQIKELFVDFNSPVKQGQLVARIDPETLEYRVRQAQADADAAAAGRSRAQVALLNAGRELRRTRELVEKNFLSAAELENREAAYQLAEADVKSAEATLAQRSAQLASARVDLGRTEIRAPVDGVVIKRSVDVGQTVAASLQAPELFVIARDLRDMQVETSIDEADIGRLRIGQPATFTVDAFPGRSFSGAVKQIRKAALSQQNVVTYTVLITAANESGNLMPGMTANVRVVIDRRESVLKVPNAALRFRPAGAAAPTTQPGAAADPAPALGGAGAGGAAAGAGDGAGAPLRERLVTGLQLDADQQARLDPILAEMRNRMMGLRELPEEARTKAAAAARAQMRARVEEILRPEQKERYAQIVAEQAGRAGSSTRGRIWALEGGQPKAIEVRVGLTDGTMSEISATEVAEGLPVIVGTQSGTAAAPAKSGPPRMMF